MKKSMKMNMRQRAAKVVLRVLELEKKTFDRVVNAIGSVQGRADKMVLKRVDAAKWMPKEGKQLVSEWVHTMKKSRGEMVKAVDVTFDLSSEFVKRVSEPPVKMKKKAPIVRKKVAAQTAAA